MHVRFRQSHPIRLINNLLTNSDIYTHEDSGWHRTLPAADERQHVYWRNARAQGMRIVARKHTSQELYQLIQKRR